MVVVNCTLTSTRLVEILHLLSNLGQITAPFWALVSLCINYTINTNLLELF